jgi:hypothetical protein
MRCALRGVTQSPLRHKAGLLFGVCCIVASAKLWLFNLQTSSGSMQQTVTRQSRRYAVPPREENASPPPAELGGYFPPVADDSALAIDVDMCTRGLCERDELTDHIVPRFWQPPPRRTGGDDDARLREVQRLHGHPTILILVSAYRDFQCPETIAQALLRAAVPERVTIAAVEQRMPGLDRDLQRCVPARSACNGLAANASAANKLAPKLLAALCGKRRRQLRTISLDARRAEGPTYPRHVLSRMYRGEEFVLQIDAHTHFVEGWDESLLAQWRATGNEFAVISSYPTDSNGSMTSGFRSRRHTRPVMCLSRFDRGRDYPRLMIHGQQPDGPPPAHLRHTPMLQPFWAAGFSFARGHWAVRVPYDPLLPMVFQGEEISMGVRAWTHGYDFYAPSASSVFHEYEVFSWRRQQRKAATPTFFDKPYRNATQELRAMNRLTALIQLNTTLLPGAYDGRAAARYGLGHVRPAALFYSTFQLDRALLRQWPLCPFVTSGRMHTELSAFLERGSGRGVDYAHAAQANYTIVGWRGVPVHMDDFPGQNAPLARTQRMDPLTIRHRHAEGAGRTPSAAACSALLLTSTCQAAGEQPGGACNSRPAGCCAGATRGDDSKLSDEARLIQRMDPLSSG